MFKHIKNNKGFSLIELMVTLAIIGILAAIAIPSYTGFQQRARQAEAKQVLGTIYVGQKAYHVEKSTYVENLETLGLEATKLNHYYSVGFNGATGSFQKSSSFAGATAALVKCDATATTFYAGSLGELSEVGKGFQMDHNKELDDIALTAASGADNDTGTCPE